MPQKGIDCANIVQGNRLAFAVTHLPLNRQRLVEKLECLLHLIQIAINSTDIVERLRLTFAVAHFATDG